MRMRKRKRMRKIRGGEMGEGGDGACGPVASGDLGDGEKWTPVVAEAIEGGFGHDRIAGGNGGEVILRPASDLAAEFGFSFGFEFVEMSGDFAFFGFDEVNANGTAVESARQRANAGEDGGRKGFEGANSVVGPFATEGATPALVTGVEQAAQFFIVGKKRVDFIEQQDWLLLSDDAKQNRCGKTFSAQRPRSHGSDKIERRGFPALWFS